MTPSFRLAIPILSAWLAAGCIGDGSGGGDGERTAASDPARDGDRTRAPPASDFSAYTHSPELDSLMAVADSLYRQESDYEAATAAYRRALERGAAAGDSVIVARALTWMGFAARHLGDYAEARRLGEEALAIKERLGHEPYLFNSYNALGLLAWSEGRYLDAVDYFDRGFDVARRTADTVSLAKVTTNLPLVQTRLGDFAGARSGFEEAIALSRAVGDTRTEGRALENLAMLEVEVGNPAAAIPLLAEARRLNRESSDETAEIYALGQLGVAYAAIGEPGRAIAHLDSALALDRSLGLRQDEASNLELLAVVHLDAGRPREALALLEQAKAINADLGLRKETGADLRREAEIYADLGDLARAERSVAEAREIHRELGAKLDELADLLLLAEIAAEAGRHDAAAGRLDEAGAVAAELDARTARVAVALTRARVAETGGRPREVLRTLDAAAADIERGGYGTESEALTLRARALARLGRLEEAAETGRRAVEAVERTHARFGSGTLRAAYLAGRLAPYTDLVDVLIRLGRVGGAFEVADAARGRPLQEQLGLAAIEGAAPAAMELAARDELLGRLDALVVALDEIDDLPPGERTDDLEAQAARLREELESVRAAYAAAVVHAAEEDPRGTRLLGLTRTSSAEVRAALRPDEAVVEFLLSPEAVYLFVLTTDGVRAFTTEVEAGALLGRIRIARDLLRRREAEVTGRPAVLSGLHELLLGPVLAAGALDGIRRLIVVPHAELDYLPFSALRHPETGAYVAEEYAVVQVPSAASIPALRARSAVATGGGVARTDDAGGGGSRDDARAAFGFAPLPDELPGTAREVEALDRAFRDARTYRGRSATERAFRDALTRPGVVHGASHGILNVWNPMFSRIVLAPGSTGRPDDDGRLEVHEVIGLPVRSSLVFLSGCETAAGTVGSTRFARGEDYATLAQAFLYAGAQNVIATLWRVEDEGSAVFAELFFDGLRSGGASTDPRSPTAYADALAAAQRATLARPEYRSPYYWAGYVLNGSGGDPAAERTAAVRYPLNEGETRASRDQVAAPNRSTR